MMLKERPRKELILKSQAQRDAEADIRAAIRAEQDTQLRCPEIHFQRWQDDPDYMPLHTLEITQEEIEIAARVLVAYSRVGAEAFGYSAWKKYLDKPMDSMTARHGFYLLETLGFACGDPYEDAFEEGTIWVSRSIPGRYGR